jgi:probable addiction module antidote protein
MTDDKQTFVYVISAGDNLHKVGVARDMRRRLAALSTGCPYHLSVSYSRPCTASTAGIVEQNAHRALSSFKLKGEWFECSVDEAIEAVRSAPSVPFSCAARPGFNASRYFADADAQLRLVSDAFQSGDPGYVANAIGVVARARGMSALAAETGLSRQALYAALSETGNPSLDTIMKVTRALGINLHADPATEQPQKSTLVMETRQLASA